LVREPALPPAARRPQGNTVGQGSAQGNTVGQGSAGDASAGWIKKKKARVYVPPPLAIRPKGC